MQEPETTVVRGKDYLPLWGIVAAAVLGVSLLCGVGVVGINDINNAVSIGTPTAGIVDFVISNMNTMIVETVQAFALPEIRNTNTAALTPTTTLVVFKTSVSFPFATLFPPRQTSGPPPPRTSTYTPLPTPTNTPKPSATYTPTVASTNTLIPTFTNTPIPPDTDTPTPAPTDTHTPTPAPTDTDTPAPTDTHTPAPTDTHTPAPTDTNTPIPGP